MKEVNNTIRKRIFFSHIVISIIFLTLTILVFDLCVRVYIQRQVKMELITASELIKNSIDKTLNNINDVDKIKLIGDSALTQLDTKNNLEPLIPLFEIKYALLGENKELLFADNKNAEEYSIISKQLIPLIKNRQLSTIEINNDEVFYLNAPVKKYALLMYPLKNKNGSTDGYLTIYTDFSKSRRLTTLVNIMLFSILLVTAIIALLISNKVSQKISRPISDLSEYAKKIGEKKYSIELIKHEDDEIGKLAETMYYMAQKIKDDDIFMRSFMQNASHELRTPLMSIQGYAEAIKYDVIEDKNKAADIIIEESKRLSSLVEDLLYLSKIELPNEEFTFDKINLADIIKSSIERVNGIAVKSEKIISFSSYDNTLVILGDEEKLIRSIINILGNCLRYCEKKIIIKLYKEVSNIIIILEDDGPGFDSKDLNNIFDRFYKGKDGNHGLGLAITKSIIEKHGGSIIAHNGSKNGAFFEISFQASDAVK